jgi:hypothetical protein
MSQSVLQRLEPKPELTRLVVNHSSRGGVKPGLITIHTTEGSNHPGITDLAGLGDLFDRPSAEASSTIANDREGNDARFVRDEDKAWTQASDNPFCLSVEQVGFADTSRADWYHLCSHQLYNTARWIAYWSEKWDIPIRRGAAPAGRLLRTGVASHKQLGISGGGHWDPGPGYPMAYVLTLAKYIKLKEKHPGSIDFEQARKKANRIRGRWDLPLLA